MMCDVEKFKTHDFTMENYALHYLVLRKVYWLVVVHFFKNPYK